MPQLTNCNQRGDRRALVNITLFYKKMMASDVLQISEVRKRLSALVGRVARGGRPVAIGRYGREQAVLMGAEEYAKLTRRLKCPQPRTTTLEGSLTLMCTPQELAAESCQIGELWLAAVKGNPSRSKRRSLRRRTPARK